MKERKLRRYQNLLTVSGQGVILFAFWSILKAVLIIFMNKGDIFDNSSAFSDSVWFKAAVIGVFSFILLVDFLIRLYVGISAGLEGTGRKKGYLYIVIAILTSCTLLLSIYFMLYETITLNNTSYFQLAVTLILEITSLVVNVELIIAAFTVKKLKKELEEV